MRAAFEERFVASEKQIPELDKWQIRKPGEDGSREEEDVTTEASSFENSSLIRCTHMRGLAVVKRS